MNKNIIIKNGKIYDSIKKRFFYGDIVTEYGKIKYAGPSCDWETGQAYVINAEGRVVSPGFIDIHSHEDDLNNSKNYFVAEDMLRMGVTTCVAGNCGTMFQPLEKFVMHTKKHGVPVNYIFFSGYNYHRTAAGIDIYEKCSTKDIKSLAVMVEGDLEAGAVGISFGLEYAPGMQADEIINLCSIIGKKDIKLSAHIRDDRDNSIPAVKEAIYIAEKTELPLFISHIGSMAAYGQMMEVYTLIEEALDKGIKVFVDCYPYNAFCTPIGCAVFDEAALNAGKFTYDKMLFASGPFAGKYCNEELYRTARKEFPMSFVVGFGMNEDEIKFSLSHELTMIGSDGFVLGNQGHPRTAGTFPRVLGKYVRDEKIMTIEEALYKMTYKPAQAIGVKTKGVLAENMDADIVIFDEDTIIDRSDYTDVNKSPEGIEVVIINGKIALKNNEIIEPYCGSFINSTVL